MAGEDGKKKQKRKKRSEDVTEEAHAEPSKIPCLRDNEARKTEFEEASPWKNLQLILSLQDKSKDLIKKIDLAFEFVKSISTMQTGDIGRPSQVASISRTLVFMNNWVQSVLVSSEKKMRIDETRPLHETLGSSLDLRCWKILHFCLEESKKLHLSLPCLRDFLRVIRCIAMDASSSLRNVSLCPEATHSAKQVELHDVALDCISLVFSFHGGVANENLDLWIFLMNEVLELTLKVYMDHLGSSRFGKFVLQLTCYLLGPFGKFLRIHPTRKNGFRDFIDKLLEPLLHLLYLLHSSSCHSDIELSTNLLELVEEVLAQALFHSTHIDGFLSSQNYTKYKNSDDYMLKVEKSVNKSYHKHLFDKVEKIVSEKKGLALAGLGEMLHLFVSCVTKHKGTVVSKGSHEHADVSGTSHVPTIPFQDRTMVSQKNSGCRNVDAELRKSIFDYFVQIMEYLLADVNKYLEPDMKIEHILLNIPGTLSSISNLLARLIYDKVYLRTEDTSEGAFNNFLRLIYDTVMSFSTRITHLQTSSFASDEKSHRDLLISARKELIVIIHHLLVIEYQVVGDDLENIWTMVFASLACSCSSMDEPLLFPDIMSLGCKLMDVYSELRQVNSSIFALCRAVKHSTVLLGDSEQSHFYSSNSNSLSKLLCSSKFRLTLSNAIKAIPEGQAAGFMRQLTSEIAESLEWINFEHYITNLGEISQSNPHNSDYARFNLQAEVLGRVLSDMYTIILDSISVSSGNSYSFGTYLRIFWDSVCASVSRLISVLPDRVKKLSAGVDGGSLSKEIQCEYASTCWILVFLFRVLLSSRCLLQKVVSLMPPDTLKNKSGLIGDSFTAPSWKDWLEMSGCGHKGFFTWTLLPSVPLLSIINYVSHIYIQDSVVICPPLAYVLHAMALQRLVGLNWLIKSSEYMLHWNQTLSQKKMKETSKLLSYRKKAKKWKKCVSDMKEEAAGLTKFILGYISTLDKDQISYPSFDGTIDDKFFRGLRSYNTPDFSVGSLDQKLLPLTLWWIICDNVDLWCSHAAKKDLKFFLTLLIEAYLSCESDHCVNIDIHNVDKGSLPKKNPAHQIALKFLTSTISLEQRSIRRCMSSRFCKILRNSVSSIFTTFEVDLSKSPDWTEVVSALENSSNVEVCTLTWSQPNMVPAKLCREPTNIEFATCQRLLALLTRMPGEYLSLKSSSLYITYVLNLERLLVGSMLGWYSVSSFHSREIFQLLVSCRRVLKFLSTSSCSKLTDGCQSPLVSGLSECPFPLSWLLKSLSVVNGFQRTVPEDVAYETKVGIFSLVDHTSNVIQTVSRDEFRRAIRSSTKLQEKRKNLDVGNEMSDLSERGLHSKKSSYACRSILQLVEILVEHMQDSLTNFKDAPLDKKVETLAGFYELNKLTSIIACFQGVLWGLASALSDENAVEGSTSIKSSSFRIELMTSIAPFVTTCINILTYLLKAFFLEDDALGIRESLSGGCDVSDDASDEGEMRPTEKKVPSNRKDGLRKCKFRRSSHHAIPDVEAFLAKVQNVKQCLKKSLLKEVVSGENTEAALFLQQLFLACSAIMRLDFMTEIRSITQGLFPVVVGISQYLLSEFSSSPEMPRLFNFYCLHAVVKFLEALGSYFKRTDPVLSKDFYVNLVDLHLRSIGKCIYLQGKEAKLASQETISYSKMPSNDVRTCGTIETSQLGEFKGRLRMSFRTYVRESSELHLLSIIQAVERALVGLREGLTTNHEILIGGSYGGKISSVVAAGIDCLDLIIDLTTGNKRLNMIKGHIRSLVASLVNIILHLQAPSVFFRDVNCIWNNVGPDPGSVVLMCIGTLATISGKPSFFQIEACHIAQSLRVPGAIFQYFLQLQLSEAPNEAASGIAKSNIAIDLKFSMELYDGCCRLLCTALKHHNNESRQCIALLQDSIKVLLHCLEIVNVDSVSGRDTSAWEVEEAVKCASSLRRVYEEVRQQNDIFGESSYLFLSSYIWVYCGLGPARRGIIREVDEALKPGIYALLDSCSADDLQFLHTTFGEGPCRSTLAALQQDYKLNYQYEGKV